MLGNSRGFVQPQHVACDLVEPRGCPLIILDRSIQACSAARGRTRRVLLESQDRCPRKPPRKTQTRVERNSFCRLFTSGPGCQVKTIGSEEVSDAGRGLKHTRGRILPPRSTAACRRMALPAQRAGRAALGAEGPHPATPS